MTATSTTFDPAAYGIAPGAAGDIVATQPGGRHETDIAVIGAGPVGLFSVFEAGMLKLKTHVIDALPHVGGQCSAMYPEKPIYDIPGWPKIEAQALIDQLAAQAAPFDPACRMPGCLGTCLGAGMDVCVCVPWGKEAKGWSKL